LDPWIQSAPQPINILSDFTLRSVLLYRGGADRQSTLRYVVLKYLHEETVRRSAQRPAAERDGRIA
jgi:hypothetical protein